MMEKTGRVEAGVTPSEVSGQPSQTIKEGQAVRKDETPDKSSIEKVAKLLDE
jgi:hypothetical protein